MAFFMVESLDGSVSGGGGRKPQHTVPHFSWGLGHRSEPCCWAHATAGVLAVGTGFGEKASMGAYDLPLQRV